MKRALLLCVLACGPSLPTEEPGKDVVRCTDEAGQVKCLRQLHALPTRNVQWQTPQGEAPDAGWPAALVFHGSFMTANPSWEARDGDKYGAYRYAQTTKALLEHGYAVITPETIHGGSWYWNTNQLGLSDNWGVAPDAEMMTDLFAAMGEGKLGRIDLGRLYATGISSGGFMTSRMAVSYGGRFRALAIASASYATCSVTCAVPDLPADHPPTLFLHGEKDSVVPISTMRAYEAKLVDGGFGVETEVNAEAGHEWLEAAVTRVPDFFDRN